MENTEVYPMIQDYFALEQTNITPYTPETFLWLC